jgi:hypothetical protein
LVAEHEIFTTPFDARAAASESIPTPAHYRTMPGGEGLGTTMNVWRVHKDPITPKNYGLVADGYGFSDSPDAEFISSGVNTKGPRAAAIARQGNFLLWGFCAEPSNMTDGARLAFLNAVVYMKRFDAAPILVKDPLPAKEKAFVFAGLWAQDKTFEFARDMFSPELLAEAKDDPSKLLAILKERRAYLRADRSVRRVEEDGKPVEYETFVFSIDEDARFFGVEPSDPNIVETCLNFIAHGEEVARAHRVLVRSFGRDLGADFEYWRRVWTNNKAFATFSETAGYRFLFPSPEERLAFERLRKAEAAGK